MHTAGQTDFHSSLWGTGMKSILGTWMGWLAYSKALGSPALYDHRELFFIFPFFLCPESVPHRV